MTGILLCEVLAAENMPQMPMTAAAEDLGADAIGIWLSNNCTWYFSIETGPAAMGLKLCLGVIEGCIAAPA
jgi:hypothetical protein